jgi:NitT/TauT family transport system substrate-binding protein
MTRYASGPSPFLEALMLRSFRRLAGGAPAAAAAFAMLTSAAPAGAQAPPTIVTVVAQPVDVTGNLWYALDQGYFAKAGLNVQVVGIANPALIVQAVSGHTVDFGSTSLMSIARAHLAGIDVVLVAPSGASSIKAPLEGIIVGNDSGIKTAKDLAGKTMVVSVLGSIIQVEALSWVDKQGGDWKSIKWVEAPPSADGAMVASGKVDGSVITETFLSSAIANNNGKLLSYVGSDVSPMLVEGGYFASGDYVRANPDVVKRFANALIEAGKWANTHRVEAAAIIQKYSQQTPSPLAHHAVFPDTFHASDLQPVLDAGAKYGALKSTFPAADMVAPNLR